MRATKEQSRLRKAFAEQYREEIQQLQVMNPLPYSNGLNHRQLLIIGKARRELGYSEKTNNIDIWRFLVNVLTVA